MTFFAAIMGYSIWWTDTTAWKFSKARCDKVWTNGIVEHWNIGSMIPSFQSSNIPFPIAGRLWQKTSRSVSALWEWVYGAVRMEVWVGPEEDVGRDTRAGDRSLARPSIGRTARDLCRRR